MLIPGLASVLFGIACVADGALGNQITVPPIWLALDVAVGIAALVLQNRKTNPWATMLLAMVSSSAIGTALTQISRISRYEPVKRGQLAGLVFCLASVLRWNLPWTPDIFYHEHWSGLVFVTVVTQCFIAWGSFFGSQDKLLQSLRDENDALARSRQSDLKFAIAQERLALSREMHDVLAHRLTLISMHASALEHRHSMPSEERQAMGRIIRSNTKASLTELRAILSNLREDQPQGHQPDIQDLPQLAVEDADPYYPVEVEVNSSQLMLPPGTGRHLYRIAQEAVTNARKHGDPGTIHVKLFRIAGQCVLEITNPAHTVISSGPGLGVKGMLERVQLCGGQLTRNHQNDVHQLRISVPMEVNQ